MAFAATLALSESSRLDSFEADWNASGNATAAVIITDVSATRQVTPTARAVSVLPLRRGAPAGPGISL
jgi:hypothetical protein